MASFKPQRGMTLLELILATAIGALLLAGLNAVVKLGLDAQANARGSSEMAYQGRFALQTMLDAAVTLAPKVLATPAANTTGDWFAPTGCTGTACMMFCRNAGNQLIETTTADTGCTGTAVLATNVTAFVAQKPSGAKVSDSPTVSLSLTLSNSSATVNLAGSARLGGGTQ